MRKTTIAFVVFIALFGIFLSQSCGEETQLSVEVLKNSHEFGTNCGSCHTAGGKGASLFTVAGSVLDEARGAIQKNFTIKLYTQPKGQGILVATIYSDTSGNFHTTEKIDFSAGLYPTLLGTPGVKEDTKHMSTPIFTGQCNSCHGPTAEKL